MDDSEYRKLVIELATAHDKLFMLKWTIRTLEQQLEAIRNPKPWVPPTTSPPS